MTRRLTTLAAVALTACGSSYQDTANPQAAPPAHRPYRDLPELVTTTTVATTTTHVHPVRASRSKRRVESRARVDGDLLDALARCESGMNRYAHGGGGRYHSYFQWLPSTWRSVSGLPGHPEDYDYATQKAAAARIPVSAWPRQFPGCARRLGL